MTLIDNRCFYIFLDEGGNFDFSPTGTRYFTLTSVSMQRPFLLREQWDDYKYDLLEFGRNIEYFHCADDNWFMRNRLFTTLADYKQSLRIDSLIVEKGLKHILKTELPKGSNYRVLHHSSRSHYGLQIADYCNWAIYRKWDRQEQEYNQQIKHLLRNEIEPFKNNDRRYY